jgi:hypothetical protein
MGTGMGNFTHTPQYNASSAYMKWQVSQEYVTHVTGRANLVPTYPSLASVG